MVQDARVSKGMTWNKRFPIIVAMCTGLAAVALLRESLQMDVGSPLRMVREGVWPSRGCSRGEGALGGAQRVLALSLGKRDGVSTSLYRDPAIAAHH
jgi:hypothetical protein